MRLLRRRPVGASHVAPVRRILAELLPLLVLPSGGRNASHEPVVSWLSGGLRDSQHSPARSASDDKGQEQDRDDRHASDLEVRGEVLFR
jgi:hypothetical protein